MEIKTDNQQTTTTAIVVAEKKSIEKITIHPSLFLLFIEFLGYETPLITWAEDWCNNSKTFPEFKKKILTIDAILLLKSVQKDFSCEQLHHYYNQFYEVALKKYAEKLEEDSSASNAY